jgi:hypothetical protein
MEEDIGLDRLVTCMNFLKIQMIKQGFDLSLVIKRADVSFCFLIRMIFGEIMNA